MALGADKCQVLRMVMGEVAVLIGSGIAAGLGITLAATRLVASFLYGVRPNDPLTLFLAGGGCWPRRQERRATGRRGERLVWIQ